MNLHRLRLFYEVAKEESITKGAERLRISQPAVTAQLQAFQKEEGIELIRQVGRGIQLTPLGERLYKKAQELFAVEGEIERLIAEATTSHSDTLRIAGNYLTVQKLLPPYLEELSEKQLQILTLNTTDSLQLLLDQEVELVVLGPLGQREGELASYEMAQDELIFVVKPDHPLIAGELTLAELSQWPFIGREKASYTQKALVKLFTEEAQTLPEFVLRFNNSREALEHLQKTTAIYFCSRLLVAEALTGKELVALKVAKPLIKHPLYLYWQRQRKLSPMAENFRQQVKKAASK